MLRTDVRGKNGSADHPPAKVTSGQEVICRSIFASRDDPPGDTEQDAEVESDRQPIEAGESGTAGLGNGEEYWGGFVHGMNNGIGLQLDPTAYLPLLSRRTVNEFPGNERVNPAPVKLSGSIMGETLVGAAREFSSLALAEVSTMAVPSPVRPGLPSRLSRVSSGLGLAFTTLTMMSPERSSFEAEANKLGNPLPRS